ncbi:MAG TPA: VanZ family protein [Planctomycetaceae bacterium]|jgi:VanZ family protein|nr:VanZ family protein [Planctomycetaceae bacterium]
MPETNSLRTRGSRIAAGIVLACYWLIMFAGTHWPHVSLESYPQNTDKLLHFTGYAGFGFLIAVWIFTKRELRPRDYATAFAVIFFYAIADEWTQPWFGRTCDFFDAVADWAGGLSGLAVFCVFRTMLRRLKLVH